MESNASSRVINHRSRRGFTLPEFLIALGIGTLALAATCVMWGFASRNCAEVLNYMGMANSSRVALDHLSRRIRNARSISSVSDYQLVLNELDSVIATFTYDPATKSLVMVSSQGGVETKQKLLSDCTNFKFSTYSKTPNPASYSLNIDTTSPWRILDVNWTCSRKLVGNVETTEHQVSAKIVVRNGP
jgi:prepilin-type N-terminal cleavage/methylation domain-containing protein